MRDLPAGTVTLLFTDIEGSTRLLTQLGERYGDALAIHRDLLRAVWTAHQGVEVDTQGDACFVVFTRAPQAVAAAVAAQRALAAYPWPQAAPVPVRMGLHTGDPRRTAEGYVGLDVHRAARIATAAHGGQILLSRSTAALTRADLPAGVTLRDLGDHHLKDIDTPEQLLQVVIPDLRDAFPPVRSLTPAGASVLGTAIPFVGREREVALLAERLEAAAAGQGSVVLLQGDAGIGKTRLLEAVATLAQAQGALVLWGRCYEGEGAPAYWPWVQVIRAYVRAHDPPILRRQMGPGAADIAQVVPEVQHALPDLPAPLPLAPEQARFRLFDSVHHFLRNATSERLVVIALDDLHWADTPSLLLLQFLARELSGSRLLLLGAYRDVDLDRQTPLTEIVAALRRERPHQRLRLGGLAAEAVTVLVRAAARTDLDAAGQQLAAELHAETDGNPFFVQEVLRHLEESGRVIVRDGTWVQVPTDIGALGLPEGVRQVIGRRLSHLSETCLGALSVAAVIGREFDLTTLRQAGRGTAAALPDDADDLLDLVSEAEAARLVEAVPGALGRYRFAHALIRETLYAELRTARRVRLHRRVGETLEQQYRTHPEPHLAELAHHFAEAAPGGDVDKAVHYARWAAERAAAQYAYEDAARWYQSALQLLELSEPGDAVDDQTAALLGGLGRAQAAILPHDRVRDAVATLRRACDLSLARGDVEAATAIALLPFYPLWGEPSGQQDLLRRVLAAVPEGSEQSARLLSRFGRLVAIEDGDPDAAGAVLGRAVAIVDRCDDAALRLRVLADVANAHLADCAWPQLRAYVGRAVDLAGIVDDPLAELDARYSGLQLAFAVGDLPLLEHFGGPMLPLAERLRDRFWIAAAHRAQVYGAWLRGDLASARAESDASLAAAPEETRDLAIRAQLEYEVGDFDQGERYLAKLLASTDPAAARSVLQQYLIPSTVAVIARIADARDRLPVAMRVARSMLARKGAFGLQGYAHIALAIAAVMEHDSRGARQQYHELLRARHHGFPFITMCMDRLLALLAHTFGDDALARRHLDEARAFCEERGLRLELAWVCYDFAALLVGSTSSAERAQGADLAQRARTLAEELGLGPLRDRAVRLLDDTRSHSPAGVPHPDGLSAREVEVLSLVAAGRSNQEIADTLVLSVGTVERHLGNLYRKIGVQRRSQATAYALAHGMLPQASS
jgi:class 3 adenylate cyclase/DNA-binding CsgD family transcriptional regulator